MIVADWSQIGSSRSRAGVIATPTGSQQPFENGNHVINIAEESVGLHMSSSSPGAFAKQIELHGYPFEPYLDLRLPDAILIFG